MTAAFQTTGGSFVNLRIRFIMVSLLLVYVIATTFPSYAQTDSSEEDTEAYINDALKDQQLYVRSSIGGSYSSGNIHHSFSVDLDKYGNLLVSYTCLSWSNSSRNGYQEGNHPQTWKIPKFGSAGADLGVITIPDGSKTKYKIFFTSDTRDFTKVAVKDFRGFPCGGDHDLAKRINRALARLCELAHEKKDPFAE